MTSEFSNRVLKSSREREDNWVGRGAELKCWLKEPVKNLNSDVESTQVQPATAATNEQEHFYAHQNFMRSSPVLEPCRDSKLSSLIQALQRGEVVSFVSSNGELPLSYCDAMTSELEASVPMVLNHDWARFLSDSGDPGGDEYQLPFDRVAYEFNCRGMDGNVAHLIIFCMNQFNEGTFRPIPHPRRHYFVGFRKRWFAMGMNLMTSDGDWHLQRRAFFQGGDDLIRAACVMLETKVAATEVVNRSPKLNRSRLRSGKAPLKDYHVVILHPRYRSMPSSEPSANPTKERKRFHFRRGHHRQYASGAKVWVSWCYVGDPLLGFVDKHYVIQDKQQ